jgi:hypothetical protein
VRGGEIFGGGVGSFQEINLGERKNQNIL